MQKRRKKNEKNEHVLDSIVAVVNDDVVTKTELNQALAITKMQMTQEGLPTPAQNVLQKQVLNQLIDKKLQLQVAKQAGVTITNADLDQTIGNIAKQNNISVAALYQQLVHEGLTKEDYRREMRDQLTLSKLQQQEVVRRIIISPQEVTTFMNSQVWQNNVTKEYHLEDILIPFSDAPSTEEITAAKKRAETLVAKIKGGENFNTVAQSESSGARALEGGDLGWRKLPEIPSVFTEYVTQMHAKEVSAPIQAPNGIHILRLAAVRSLDAKKSTLDRKQVENLLLQRKFEEALQNWVSKLRGQAFVVMKL